MKNFLIVSERNIDNHVGEEWDDFIEVSNQPTTTDIDEWANRIRGRIRKLHEADKKAYEDPKIEVHVDAASPFVVVAQNLQIIMGGEENTKISLPQFDGKS